MHSKWLEVHDLVLDLGVDVTSEEKLEFMDPDDVVGRELRKW